VSTSSFQTIAYDKGVLSLIDQRKLPTEECYLQLTQLEAVAQSIETMVVRGAPAIGVTAAYGIVIAAKTNMDLQAAHDRLARTRPTAVNLFWALERMKKLWSQDCDFETLQAEANSIYREDVAACRSMGEHGAQLIEDGATILTHCNAGALATSEYGTALSVIRFAHAAGKNIKVFADETRPVLQGARLTAWELMRDGIDVTVIPDNAVAHLLSQDLIDCAVVGADRIAANGDVANKIGTRQVAGMLHLHDQRPLYVAAPWSTIDMSLSHGSQIPIEERSAREVTHIGDVQVTPDGVCVRNPAFDITPAAWIESVITEIGVTGKDIGEGLRRQADERQR
jgi:methylthioribose-1-phosphate isomerase